MNFTHLGRLVAQSTGVQRRQPPEASPTSSAGEPCALSCVESAGAATSATVHRASNRRPSPGLADFGRIFVVDDERGAGLASEDPLNLGGPPSVRGCLGLLDSTDAARLSKHQ